MPPTPIPRVGRAVKRLEDPKLVTGSDPYVNDVRLENALTMAVVRSPHAHAEMRRVDTAAAQKVPGVVAVLTGADVNPDVGIVHTHVPQQAFDWVNLQGRALPAEDRVRHVGEAVAVVIADTLTALPTAPTPSWWTTSRSRPSSTRSPRWRRTTRCSIPTPARTPASA